MTDFAVITGLSGAGRSTAADVLEDQDWFVIDNMPVALMPKVGELALLPGSDISRVAFVVGSNSDTGELEAMLDDLRSSGSRVRVLFLDARSDVLIRRYESSRRRHPASAGALLGAAIEQERLALDHMRALSDVVVDTSDLNVHQLRERVEQLFADDDATPGMQVTVLSFGFKHGLPADVDMVLDCRFLPNPHWVDDLRPQTGQDEPVRDYVLGSELAHGFLDRLDGLLDVLLPAYQAEGKAYLTLAFGCTGGRHRSVAIAEEVARRMEGRGLAPGVAHRDVAKGG
ncbi:RNase adapter RapZ [Aquihabitans sp. G128]|uniref:RNase adapter RapZ n=1 Tax=Aquihabitans sp. G128 TaxID=2849779 RepID=UPI001C236542|nr:RNase adapter RapZ [Aquihabitans sp. G128]QXC61715.1 RNase adapter RapZ [Aquihabitans sp. G128]